MSQSGSREWGRRVHAAKRPSRAGSRVGWGAPHGEEDMAERSLSLDRILKAKAERVYRAFLDPEAVVKWLPPNGFTCKVDHIDARVGGTFRMSFQNFSTGKIESFGGKYLDRVPAKLIRNTDSFEDAKLPGVMETTVSLTEVFCGTELTIVQKGIPDAIPLEACYLGWQESLVLLAKLVEAEIAED